jgi:hypothetical protein
MKWNIAKKLRPEHFKRLVGVQPNTFETMVSEAKRISKLQPQKVKGKKRGPKGKLSWRDKVLMMLMYYREYRTFAHIAASYNISEAQCWRIITTMEQYLIKSKLFHLPGKKTLTKSDMEWEVVIVDVSEHPIERPKKNNDNIIQGKRKNIP